MMRRLVFVLVAILWASLAVAQTGTVMPVPRLQFLDNTGVPLAGGFLYTYAAGTTTPQATCATPTLTSSTVCATALPNPITLDSAGRPQTGGNVETAVYLLPKGYKFVLQNSSGVTVYTQDNIQATLSSSGSAFSGIFTFNAPTVLTLAANTITPTQNVHAVDTSGGAANLNTITTTNVTQAFELFLYPNNAASNPVTVKNGAGNITLINGDYTLNASGMWIHLMLQGSTWFEVGRNVVASTKFQCAYTKSGQTTSSAPALCTLVEQTSGSSITVTLPAASGCTVWQDRVGLKNDTANSITVARSGSDTIDGATSFATPGVQYESFDFVCNAAGTGWMIR